MSKPAKTRRKGSHSTGTLIPPAARGKSWAIRWVEDGERKYAGGYENKDKVTEALGVIIARITAGMPGTIAKPVELKPGRTIGQLAEEWLEAKQASKSYRDDKNRYDKHIAPTLAHVYVEKVSKASIDDLVTHLKTTKLSPASIERVVYVLSGFYRWAIRKELVKVNPVREWLASLERTERAALRTTHDARETPFLDRAGVQKLYKHLKPPVQIAYALSALAGLRPGEVRGLEWLDVNLEAASLKVRRRIRNGKAALPKSGKARDVPLVPSLVEVLKSWRKANPDTVLVIPPDARLINADRSDGKVVKYVGESSIQSALDEAFKAAKMKRLTFYEAGRHSFASNWVIAGLDIYRLSKIMGHSSVETTQRYAHLAKKAPDAILAKADIKLAS